TRPHPPTHSLISISTPLRARNASAAKVAADSGHATPRRLLKSNCLEHVLFDQWLIWRSAVQFSNFSASPRCWRAVLLVGTASLLLSVSLLAQDTPSGPMTPRVTPKVQ